MPDKPRPPVLIFAATDGTAGAGVVADCRTVLAAGCAPFAVVTGITAQNLSGVDAFWPLPAAQVRRQFAMSPAHPAAIKIGVVGNVAAVAACLARLPGAPEPGAPVVWDPVFAPSAGAVFNDAAAVAAMRRLLLPRAFVLTPNRRELLALADCRRAAAAAAALCRAGAAHVLVTDIDGRGAEVRHVLFAGGKPQWEAKTPRRAATYHGSGCLFSSVLAARLAHGDAVDTAAAAAHQETLRAMDRADKKNSGAAGAGDSINTARLLI